MHTWCGHGCLSSEGLRQKRQRQRLWRTLLLQAAAADVGLGGLVALLGLEAGAWLRQTARGTERRHARWLGTHRLRAGRHRERLRQRLEDWTRLGQAT